MSRGARHRSAGPLQRRAWHPAPARRAPSLRQRATAASLAPNPTQVSGWCFRREWSCRDASAWEISNFKSVLKTCIQEAVNVGFKTIVVLPHNDIRGEWRRRRRRPRPGWGRAQRPRCGSARGGAASGGRTAGRPGTINTAPCRPRPARADGYTWRNLLDYDPLAKYNGFSYDDVLIVPVAEAMREVWERTPDTLSVGGPGRVHAPSACAAAPAARPPAAGRVRALAGTLLMLRRPLPCRCGSRCRARRASLCSSTPRLGARCSTRPGP